MSLKTIVSHSSDETIEIGKKIGSSALSGSVLFLLGGLGAGKTTLCKGIALGLGIRDEITSPTFTIINEYSGKLRFLHMDAYRLSGESDFFETGGMDMLGLPGSFSVIEWSERLPGLMKESSDKIDITAGEGGTRIMKISGQWLEELFL